jgi:quinol monooxygenase YgiN
MIEVRVTLKPKAGKLTEVRQTLESIAAAILAQRGCEGCTYTAPGEDASIQLVQSWSDRAAVNAYLNSREHRALLGAIETLCDQHSLSLPAV